VRVPVGTRVEATIRNELGHELNIRGLAAPGQPNFLYLLETINGRSFPATEPLTYDPPSTRVRPLHQAERRA